MFWVDEIAQKIGSTPQHVDDMKTLSGYPHIGSLRGPILHDVVYKALHEKNNKTINTCVFNDFDHIDGLSPDLLKTHAPYFGYPLRLAPSPDKKARSFADYFAQDFKQVLETLGVEAEYLSSWDMYHEGKFNEAIKIALDNAEKIQDIYKQISGSDKKRQGWYPLQVICPNCSKVGTTKVTAWDGKMVTYRCEKNLVKWAEGCGHLGTMSPFDGNARLPWKVDWPAHWMVLGVTFEGAGKDHASRGGSYDIAFALCDEVFKSNKPYYFPYEFFLFGGKKMSTSKGTGIKARDITAILPSEVARFLLVRTPPRKAIDFDPTGMTIPDLFDEFDRCAQEYWHDSANDLGRVFHFSQINNWYRKDVYLPRFRDIANVIQLHTKDPEDHFRKEKGSSLTATEKEILKQRITYAQKWLENYAPENARFSVSEKLPNEIKNLSQNQKRYLGSIINILESYRNPESLQVTLYNTAKEMNLSGKDAFQALYISLLGKPFGPKAGWFIDSLDKEFVIKRLSEASEYSSTENSKSSSLGTDKKRKSDLALIDHDVSSRFVGMSFAVAVIKNVLIKKQVKELEKDKKEVLEKIGKLTTEDISLYSTIQAYRKLFKSFGIDWHSRRPSPEALLRRIALGKGLYTVNTLVDAYNLAVLESKIGLGSFDLSEIALPVTLRFAKEGETIHLLGDDSPTIIKNEELVYADQKQIITLDLNYRDANNTKVTEETKNIILFSDGAPGISAEEVMKGLEKGIEYILKYCGGTVEKKELIM